MSAPLLPGPLRVPGHTAGLFQRRFPAAVAAWFALCSAGVSLLFPFTASSWGGHESPPQVLFGGNLQAELRDAMGGAGARLALLGRGRAELRGVPGWANLLTSNFPLKAEPCVSSSKPRAERRFSCCP